VRSLATLDERFPGGVTMIRRLGETVGNVVLEGVGRVAGRVQETTPLPVDLLESDDAYLAVFDAPGALGSDVDVRFDRNTVHVRVDRFRDHYDGYTLRFPGRGRALSGEVDLPEDAHVDPSGATATLTDSGTLQVHIPKTKEPHEERSDGDESAESVDVGDESGN
jgi:HSP20 family molecular chaperone IbpA